MLLLELSSVALEILNGDEKLDLIVALVASDERSRILSTPESANTATHRLTAVA